MKSMVTLELIFDLSKQACGANWVKDGQVVTYDEADGGFAVYAEDGTELFQVYLGHYDTSDFLEFFHSDVMAWFLENGYTQVVH